jgi:hypothetical protein
MIGVVVALLVAGACSDDDDEGGFGGLGGGSGSGSGSGNQVEVPGPSGDEGAALGDSSTFISSCTSFPGADVSLCECAWNEISGTVSAEEYAAFEEEFLSDPSTSLPSWLTDAVAACS